MLSEIVTTIEAFQISEQSDQSMSHSLIIPQQYISK